MGQDEVCVAREPGAERADPNLERGAAAKDTGQHLAEDDLCEGDLHQIGVDLDLVGEVPDPLAQGSRVRRRELPVLRVLDAHG